MDDGRLRIAELARRVGVSAPTLHHYEEAGLLCPAARSEAGYRLYRPEAASPVGPVLDVEHPAHSGSGTAASARA